LGGINSSDPKGYRMQEITDYKADLNRRYWEYQKSRFPAWGKYFDCPYSPDERPPVFLTGDAWRNVIINPKATDSDKDRLLALVLKPYRHKWFRSMNSSQALAQSVLGNLAVYDLFHRLAELECDEGESLLGKAKVSSDNFAMEYEVKHLGEPRPTSLDGYFFNGYRVAIECKFTEFEVGTCSRPRLSPKASNVSIATVTIPVKDQEENDAH
jgi:hypothetical protein